MLISVILLYSSIIIHQYLTIYTHYHLINARFYFWRAPSLNTQPLLKSLLISFILGFRRILFDLLRPMRIFTFLLLYLSYHIHILCIIFMDPSNSHGTNVHTWNVLRGKSNYFGIGHNYSIRMPLLSFWASWIRYDLFRPALYFSWQFLCSIIFLGDQLLV